MIAASFRAPVLWVDPKMGYDFLPNHYVDITPFRDLKEQAILCQTSQGPEHFVEMSRVQGRFRSAQCGELVGVAAAFRHAAHHAVPLQTRFPNAQSRQPPHHALILAAWKVYLL